MNDKIMPPLNDLYMAWDVKGGYWYSPNGKEITPQEMMEYAIQLESVADAARHLIHSLSSPSEPTNLAKSPVAAYLFAEDLREKLKALGGE